MPVPRDAGRGEPGAPCARGGPETRKNRSSGHPVAPFGARLLARILSCGLALSAGCLPSAGVETPGASVAQGNAPVAQPNDVVAPDPNASPPKGQGPNAVDPNAQSANAPLVAGLRQGGVGWSGDVNVAATSAQYDALTLDALEAARGPMAQALLQRPRVEAAIRQVARETGVPAGLLAGLCYQESGFDPNATSNNPNPTPDDPRDVGLTQAPEPAFNGNDWRDPATNLRLFVVDYLLPDYQKHGSWGVALRLWNSGEVLDANNLGREDNNTDPAYVQEILGRHCMGLD